MGESPVAATVEMDPRLLAPHPRNWRLHPERQKKALRAALSRFGFLEAILWNETTGTLIDGHARVEEAIALDLPTVPVVAVQLSPLDELTLLAECDRLGEICSIDEFAQLALLRERIEECGGPPPAYVGDELLARLQPLDLAPDGGASASEPEADDGWRQATFLFTPEEYQEYLALLEGEEESRGVADPARVVLAVLEEAL